MTETLSDVIKALDSEHNDNWFVVGSFAAWVYLLSSKKTPTWSKVEWNLIVPGDIDIAISYSAPTKATVKIGTNSQNKIDISYELVESANRCGQKIILKELELVYNDSSNNLHKDAVVDENLVPGLRMVPVNDLVTRLGMGSAKSPEKNDARKKREAGLRAAYGMPKSTGSSLFADIGALRKT